MRTILNTARRHDITFHSSGRIDIGARLARTLDLHPGDTIDIVTDDPVLIYVRHRHATGSAGSYQAKVYPTKSRSHNYRCYCKTITSYMLSTFPPPTAAVLSPTPPSPAAVVGCPAPSPAGAQSPPAAGDPSPTVPAISLSLPAGRVITHPSLGTSVILITHLRINRQ